jgi:hypothetical protein
VPFLTRAMSRTIACGPFSEVIASSPDRLCSIARICSRTTCSRARWRRSSARVFSSKGTPSAVRRPSRCSSALRSVGRKVRMPKRVRIALIWFTIRVCSVTQRADLHARCPRPANRWCGTLEQRNNSWQLSTRFSAAGGGNLFCGMELRAVCSMLLGFESCSPRRTFEVDRPAGTARNALEIALVLVSNRRCVAVPSHGQSISRMSALREVSHGHHKQCAPRLFGCACRNVTIPKTIKRAVMVRA